MPCSVDGFRGAGEDRGCAYITRAAESRGAMRARDHTAASRGGNGGRLFGGGGEAAVEGLQQKTFQETRRHNLLIRGRLVQRAMRVCVRRRHIRARRDGLEWGGGGGLCLSS